MRATMPITPGWLGWGEASAYSGLSISTLRALARKKLLRTYRPTPNRTLLKREEIDAYLASTELQPAS